MRTLDFLVGEKVVEIRYGLELRIVFRAGERVEPALYADIGRSSLGRTDGTDEGIDPSDPPTVAPVLLLVGRTVGSASVGEDASLQIAFSDGFRLRCDAAETHEAWQVVGGSPQHLVVAVGPGDVAVFGESEPRSFG